MIIFSDSSKSLSREMFVICYSYLQLEVRIGKLLVTIGELLDLELKGLSN